ncbi:hypothetical protein AN959_03230 [Psychrobacillus sp. FJAT-21963]|nr:hypothetical protein AN959_03230 [Psychrobacillus sp. FJAT-21963]
MLDFTFFKTIFSNNYPFQGISDCRQTQRNLKLSIVFFLFTIHSKKSSISVSGATLSTGTVSAFSLAPAQARRRKNVAPAQSSSQKTMLLRKLVAEKTLLLRKLVAKINFATLSPGASARAVPVGVFAPSTPID